jgi:hypothetical protein
MLNAMIKTLAIVFYEKLGSLFTVLSPLHTVVKLLALAGGSAPSSLVGFIGNLRNHE